MNKSEYEELKLNLIKKSLESKKTEVYVPKERRKGEDGVLKFINLMSFLVWGAVFIVFAVITKAGRSIAYIKNQELLWVGSDFWKSDLLIMALIMTIVCIGICTVTIILNFTRHRRRTDRIKKSVIFCELISFAIGAFLILKLF